MKLIVRIDDIGYTDINNMGSFLAIHEGIATAADVMLDTPGTEDALRRLKECPWISVGWHTHFWGSPVLPAEQVPSLIQENGHFKPDKYKQPDLNYDEAFAELEAEVLRCQKILGRMPAYAATISGNNIFKKAINDVCDKYGIVRNFMTSIIGKEFMPELSEAQRTIPAAPKWQSREILCPPAPFTGCLFNDDLNEILKYGEASRNYYINDPDGLFDRTDYQTIVTVWHPGYIDTYMINEGEPGDFARHFDSVRYQDINTLCSEDFKNWICEKKIELVNFTDAMYGRRDYQNHLIEVGSPLAI